MHRQASPAQTAKNSRPNIIVILADDQGYGDLGIFGNSYLKTPHLDRLAGEGLCLNQHYTAAPVCAPARASLLTGRYNHRTGALSTESHRGLDRIALCESTIADHLKAAGYATGMIGKWHNGLHDVRYHPNHRGFQEFAGFLNGGMWYYDWILDYNGQPRRSDGRYLTECLLRRKRSVSSNDTGANLFSFMWPITHPMNHWRRLTRRSGITSIWGVSTKASAFFTRC